MSSLLPWFRSLSINKSHRTLKAFTLIEVMVSMVVVIIISAASWMAVSTLGPTSRATLNRVNAQNLIAYTQEEILSYAQIQSQFNNLNTICNSNPSNCGFSDNLPALFPEISSSGVTRTITVTNVGTNSQLKEVHVHVQWNEFGGTKPLDSVLLIAPPPIPLPGNVVGVINGTVDGGGNPVLVNSANITITAINNAVNNGANNGAGYTANSSSTPVDIIGNNYTFVVPATGQYQVNPGSYQITAVTPPQGFYPIKIGINGNYASPYDSLPIITVDVKSALPTTVFPPITLIKMPDPAVISGNITFPQQGVYLSGRSTISLYQNGILQHDQNGNSQTQTLESTYSFTVPFQNTDEQCFTIATSKAYESELVGTFSCTGFDNDTFNSQADGWSTSGYFLSTSAGCSMSSWLGNSTIESPAPGGTDICVKPGDKYNKVNITLDPVPMVTITGYVVSDDKPPVAIEGADIYASWPNSVEGTSVNNYGSLGKTDSNGKYTVQVPAVQNLFPDNGNYYLNLWAQKDFSIWQCCDTNKPTGDSKALSINNANPGPLSTNLPSPISVAQNLIIKMPSSAPKDCGNAFGFVTNDYTKEPVVGITIFASSVYPDSNTGTQGDYAYTCGANSTGFKLPVGPNALTENAGQYYPLDGSHKFYIINNIVNVVSSQNTQAPPLALWPINYGNLSGTVYVAGTGTNPFTNPIKDIQVTLTVGLDGSTQTTYTDSTGKYSFTHVPETWPPAGVLNNPNYNQNQIPDQIVANFQPPKDNSSLNPKYNPTFNTATTSATVTADANSNFEDNSSYHSNNQDIPLTPTGGT